MGCHFQNVPFRVPFSIHLPFSKSAGKMCHFCVSRRSIRQIFTVFKICRHRVITVLLFQLLSLLSFQMLRHKIEEADLKSKMQDEELKGLKNLQSENDVNSF